MFMFINLGLIAIAIFMVAGLYGKLDEILRSVTALRKAVNELQNRLPAAATGEPPSIG